MRLSPVFVVAIVMGSVTLGRAADPGGSARAEQAQLTLQIPRDFPLSLSVVVSGRITGRLPAGSVFQLTNAKDGSHTTIAQKDSATGYIWFMTQVNEVAQQNAILTFLAQPGRSDKTVTIEERKDGFQFSDSGRDVMFYQKTAKSDDAGHTAANYVHPLRGLDGEVLSEDFPADHPHHHGVFWAWHQLWVGDKRLGDPWINKDFLPVVRSAQVIDSGPVFATLRATVDWTSPLLVDEADGQPKSVVEEITQIRLFHATSTYQYVDFRISLRALVDDVSIGGAENARGYSGFTVRVKPPNEMQITDVGGRLSQDHVGTNSPWADVSGHFTPTESIQGVAILSHPSLPEFPPRWLLRHYGMQNVVYPGRDPITLSRRSPLVLQHRLVIHRGTMQKARIPDHQKAYEAFPGRRQDPNSTAR